MIAEILGRPRRTHGNTTTILTPGGIGYQVHLSAAALHRVMRTGIEGRDEVHLFTHQMAREGEIPLLFGFASEEERQNFVTVTSVQGVGPKTGLAIVSSLDRMRLADAVAARDTATLRKIPGIGPKTADRLILELGGKLTDLHVSRSPDAHGDPSIERARQAALALVALGFSESDALRKAKEAQERDPDASITQIITLALQL